MSAATPELKVVKPMLAKDAPADLSKLPWPQIGQIKYDGIRAFVVNGELRSRSFKLIPNLEVRAALEKPEFEGLDGEIIVGEPEAEGCMQATSSFVMAPNKTGADWKFYVFDKWDAPGSYMARRTALWKMVFPGFIWRVTGGILKNETEAERFEAKALAEGHEGIILRDPNGLYKHGRSGTKGPLLKLKRFIDFEAEIVGVYEELHNANEAKRDAFGRTERSTVKANKTGKGRLGGFELRAINGPHKGQEFRCGTGFNAAQRDAIWAEHHHGISGSYEGVVVKIKSFPVGVKDAPRFPVFLGFRDMEIDG